MTTIISVENLNFTYPGAGQPAVKGISFDVQQGEILGFLGPSGAGKSTTQKILTRLLQGYSGGVNVFGKPLTAWSNDYYEHIGVSFELPNHFLKLTALENLKYFASLYGNAKADPRVMLEKVGLGDDANTLVGQFSKGMKMRLNFVRSLLNQPKLLFLDEPTSGLDPVNSAIVKNWVMELKNQGVTVFLTTHDMNVAEELSDRVAFMVHGQISLLDTPKALKLRYGTRDVLVEYQNGGAPALSSQRFALDGLGENPQFINLLRDSHARIETIHTQETTLEKIFIEVTGQELSA